MPLVLMLIKKSKGIKDPENKLNDACFIEEDKTLWSRYLQKYITVNQDKFKKVKESLGLFKNREGLYRCREHLGNANIIKDTKYPVYY